MERNEVDIFFLSQLATSSVYSHAFQQNSSAKYFAECHLKLLLANHLINPVQLGPLPFQSTRDSLLTD